MSSTHARRPSALTYALFLAAVLGAASLSRQAHAEDLRCGGRLASLKMTGSEVEKICGAPNERRGREVLVSRTRTVTRKVPTPGVPGYTSVSDSETYTVPLQIDEWIYMGQPGELVRLLIFEGGRLSAIQVLDRASTYADRVGHILDTVPPYSPPSERLPDR